MKLIRFDIAEERIRELEYKNEKTTFSTAQGRKEKQKEMKKKFYKIK